MDTPLDPLAQPTATLARTPPRPPLALGTLGAAGLAGLLLVAHVVRPFAMPWRSVRALLATLAEGDTARLLDEERLGFRHRAEREVRARGELEYARILGLFDKAERLGDREYRRVRRDAWQIGERQFRTLTRDEQRATRERSRAEFLAEKGWAILGDDERKQLGSADVLSDRAALLGLAYTLGQGELSAEEKALLEGKDPASAEVARDRALKKLVDRAQRAGWSQISAVVTKAQSAGTAELLRLPHRERTRIENASYNQWVFDAGIKGYEDAARLKLTVDALADDESAGAAALRRSFGRPGLEAAELKSLAGRDYDRYVAEKKAFVEREGTRLYGEFLRMTFTPGCCSIGKVRYLGDSARSLLRSSTATAALEFGPPPPPAPPKPAKPGQKAPPAEEETERVHPARKVLGDGVSLEHRWGSWHVVDFEGAAEPDGARGKGRRGDEALKAALGALSSLGAAGGLAGFILFGVLGVAIVVVVVLRRPPPVIAPVEATVAAAALLVGIVQIAVEGQVSLDDLVFTPLYLALPVWAGARRGAESGFVTGFLVGVGVLAAGALARVAPWAAAPGDWLHVAEHLLATLFFAMTGALAGRLRERPAAAVAVPLLWLLFYVAADRSLLASLVPYFHVLLAAALAGAGLIAARRGLWARFAGA